MTPQRIQLSRRKGWRMPPNTVKVDRTNKKYGNKYRIGMFKGYTAEDAVRDYRKWLDGDLGAAVWAGPPPTVEEIRADLRGKNIGCWCKLGDPCHGNVLLELANS